MMPYLRKKNELISAWLRAQPDDTTTGLGGKEFISFRAFGGQAVAGP
jgi:hypothetical protein